MLWSVRTVVDRTLHGPRSVGVAALAGAALMLAALFGPPKLFEYSESPGFCGRCHEMERESWERMGSHRRERCVECHLPNRHWIPHILAKGIHGTRDVVAYASGRIPDPIRLSEPGQRIVHDNCVRCHGAMVSRIDAGRRCFRCHRRSTHRGATR
ncbi:MAG: NapC/NirT family cytochrome c [Candidatus Riflebacteria bacterium]|nr:NapC/NirT family cytochrome c [Candidatus Riflebacteria bacterium]